MKILHPNVGSGIDADLDILRVVASLLDRYDERVKWLNFPGMVEEVRRNKERVCKFTLTP